MAFFAQLNPTRRCLVIGALAGVVLELCVSAALLWPAADPAEGAHAIARRTQAIAPFVATGTLALAVGLGAFAAAIGLAIAPALWPRRAAHRARRAGPAKRTRRRGKQVRSLTGL